MSREFQLSQQLFDDVLQIYFYGYARRSAEPSSNNGYEQSDEVERILRSIYIDQQMIDELSPEMTKEVEIFGYVLGYIVAERSEEMGAFNRDQADNALWIRSKLERDDLPVIQDKESMLGVKARLLRSGDSAAKQFNKDSGATSLQGLRADNEDRFVYKNEVVKCDDPASAIQASVLRLGASILHQQIDKKSLPFESGTTYTMATVQKGQLYAAIVGDGAVLRLVKTVDGGWDLKNCVNTHNGERVNFCISSDLTAGGSIPKTDGPRFNWRFALSRALGDASWVHVVPPWPSITQTAVGGEEVEFELVIVCCDGLTDGLHPQAFIDIVSEWYTDTGGKDFRELSSRLCAYAFSCRPQPKDNMTAVCFKVEEGNTAVVLDGHAGSGISEYASKLLQRHGIISALTKGPDVTIHLPEQFCPAALVARLREYQSPHLPERVCGPVERYTPEHSTQYGSRTTLFGGKRKSRVEGVDSCCSCVVL